MCRVVFVVRKEEGRECNEWWSVQMGGNGVRAND